MTVSIKDIAKAANVSYSTVSRALNNSPRVKPETREQIQRIAAEMGYVPSAVGRSLVKRYTDTIGIVVRTVTDLFFAEIISAIEQAALEHGYSVILAGSGGERRRELEAIRTLQERRVDGIIVASGYSRKEDICVQKGIHAPIVIINNVREEHIGYSIEADNLGGGREATQHLLDLGHRRIAYIAGPVEEWDSIERQRGYEEALRAHGLVVDPALIVRGNGRPEGGKEAIQQLLALPTPPTAVFCYSDVTALGVMRAAWAAGLRVPQDLSAVGFDDIDLAPWFEPPLTTIAQPMREMGKKAVQMLLDLLADDKLVEDCVLPSRLVVRESTMSPE